MSDIDPHVVANFFALVLLAGATLLAISLTRSSGRSVLSADALRLVAVVATGATAGSLYFSEIADFRPCELCWFQRIAMYPIAFVGVIAVARKDRTVLPYVRALAIVGAAVSLYHVGIQLFPEQSSVCDASNPCSGRLVEGLGWMTIPQMAALCFTVIIALTTIGVRADRKVQP